MTRRERHTHIIENHGDSPSARYEYFRLTCGENLGVLNDDAIEKLARALVGSHKRQQRYNREASARRSA